MPLAPRMRIAPAAADIRLRPGRPVGAAFALPGRGRRVRRRDRCRPTRRPPRRSPRVRPCRSWRRASWPSASPSATRPMVQVSAAAHQPAAGRRHRAGRVGGHRGGLRRPGRHRRRRLGRRAAADRRRGCCSSPAAIDAGRRSDLALDGSDLAAAAVTAALIATLARIAAVLSPGGQLAVAAALVLVVAVAARAMPEEWRRGPVARPRRRRRPDRGAGRLVGAARRGGCARHPGPDLGRRPDRLAGRADRRPDLAGPGRAGAARRRRRDPAARPRGSTTWRASARCWPPIGAPAAFDLPWWSPVLVGG